MVIENKFSKQCAYRHENLLPVVQDTMLIFVTGCVRMVISQLIPMNLPNQAILLSEETSRGGGGTVD